MDWIGLTKNQKGPRVSMGLIVYEADFTSEMVFLMPNRPCYELKAQIKNVPTLSQSNTINYLFMHLLKAKTGKSTKS